MDSISKKITSRAGFSKAIRVIRKRIVCFKEGRELVGDDCLHCFRDEWNDCSRTIVKWLRFVSIRRKAEINC